MSKYIDRNTSSTAKLTKDRRHLFEIVGLIYLLFPKDTTELKAMIDPFEKQFEYFSPFKSERMMKEAANFNELTKLEEWQSDKFKEIQETAAAHIDAPIEKLLIFLKEKIDERDA